MPLTILNVGFPLAKVSPRTAGGAEQVLLTLDRGLVRRGYRSLVLAPAGSRCHGLLIPAQIPSGPFDDSAKREAQQTFKMALKKTLARFSVDIVHMHGLDFYEYLPEEDVPVVVSLHLPLSWYRPEALRPGRANTELVCVSESQLASAPLGVRISRVVRNGVELQEFSLTRRKGDYALLIGRICPEKAFDVALDAAERARVRVIVAGTVFEYPEHRAYFERTIQPRFRENVRFVGEIGQRRKGHLLSGAKCLLIPSQAKETSSLVAMEAAAAGTPVIAWNSGALPEIVAHGSAGFVVSSIEEMAEAIGRSNTISPGACRREALQRFDSERMLREYVDLYHSLADTRKYHELQVA